jgi:hypothetical protein
MHSRRVSEERLGMALYDMYNMYDMYFSVHCRTFHTFSEMYIRRRPGAA